MNAPAKIEQQRRPRPDDALAFLEELCPAGPWAVTAIWPDQPTNGAPRTTTRSYTSREADKRALRDWIGQANNDGQNFYFSLNPLREGVTRSKENIAEARWLWVDIDPRAGEDPAAEERRIAALTQGENGGYPEPSLAIQSGGGHWALWRLDKPVPLPGGLAEVEARAVALERAFGADACHDVNRICRLPGTINWPDEKKRRKGRVPALATWARRSGEAYPIDRFPPDAAWARTEVEVKSFTAPERVDRVADLAVLDQWGVPDRVKVIIAQGRHPDETKDGDDSRSAWLFDAVCNMARCEVPDEVIFSLITDPEWPISESVCETPNPTRYAARQIDRAKEAVVSPELAELNERHAVLEQEGGKTRVLCWAPSELEHGREVPILQTFEDFRNRYMNRSVVVFTDEKGRDHKKPLGKWWLEHEQRRQYRGLTFRPGQPEQVDGYLNLWRGFAVAPRKGDWSRLERHIREVLAAGEEPHAEYILNWIAWTLQNPHRPAEVALVLRGGRGTGKGTLARVIKALFGQHGLQVNSPMQLTGRFNEHLRDCCFLFADEALAPGDKAAESVLKGLITEPELVIEGKGKNAVQTPNRLHIMMASNEGWVVPAGADERRFAMFDVSGERASDKRYWDELYAEIGGGGPAAMLHDLLARDLGDFKPRWEVPSTAALRAQKELSLSPAEAFILSALESGEIDAVQMRGKRPGTFCSNDQGRDPGLYTAMRRSSPGLKHESDQRLAATLKAWGCAKALNGRSRGWAFPSLGEMRAEWERKFGGWEWDGPVGWAGAEEVDHDHPF